MWVQLVMVKGCADMMQAYPATLPLPSLARTLSSVCRWTALCPRETLGGNQGEDADRLLQAGEVGKDWD